MINPIDGSGPVRGPSSVRRTSKAGKTKGTGFSKHLDNAEEADSASAASGVGFVSGILEAQEVDDALARASKGKMRADELLDRLEDLRLGILNGTMSPGKLQQLSHIVNVRRPEVTDPRLGEILDEIDLRAQVELAKFSRQ
ncbi:MAG: flagellar assembly protein FliX [Alphaproteobacteria bacterium]|nr:flagellar assembly protein FliX [Alphaproteobacteria bacterium]